MAMDELIKLVVAKTGISEDAARQAIETVLDFLKGKLPAPLGEQLEGLLGGAESPEAGGLLSGLGGLLGKR